MTQPFDDEYGDRLRRALHAEAEAVTPSAEGLERIRSKINKRNERQRFGIFSAIPWLRPLAAVAAAVCVCVVAVSVTPALANFVQTGHFSPDAGGSNGNSTTNDGQSNGQVAPGQSSTPYPSSSPSPSGIHPSNTGKHVVDGTCPPGETTVTPSSTPSGDTTTASDPAPHVTCQKPGGPASPPPVTDGPAPPPASSPPEVPPTDPPASDPPTVPNQSNQVNQSDQSP